MPRSRGRVARRVEGIVIPVAFASIVVATALGAAEPAPAKTSEAYFGSFGGYGLPLEPVEPLSKEEAEGRQQYVVARYESGRLVHLRKMLRGAVFLRHDYEYDADGRLTRATVTRKDGSSSVLERSAAGRMVPKQ